MIFGLIKKVIQKHWQNDLSKLHQNLSISFGNIRNDIEEIHTFLQQHKELFNHFENRISTLENNLDYSNEPFKPEINKDLTSTQKKIFLAIYEIQNKANSNVSSLKSLSKLLYPNKKLSSIRSTISEYIKVLEKQGLIVKKRIGKETYVALTEQGILSIKQLNKKRKKKQKIIN